MGTDDPCIVAMQKVTPEPNDPRLQLDSCHSAPSSSEERDVEPTPHAQMMRGKEGLLSLAQGIVFWGPPKEAVAAATAAVGGTASPPAACKPHPFPYVPTQPADLCSRALPPIAKPPPRALSQHTPHRMSSFADVVCRGRARFLRP